MEECRNLRCVQEKKYFRRELLSWYKKVPYVVGLELVAENLAERSSANIKTLLLPFNDMEPSEPSDFDELTARQCVYCEGQSDDYNDNDVEENKSLSTEKYGNVESELARSDEDSVMKQMTSLTGLPWDMSDLEGFNSFYNKLAMTSLLYQQQQLQSAAVAAAQAATSSQQISSLNTSLANNSDDPLDLSSTHVSGTSNSNLVGENSNELKVPEIKTKNKKDNGLKRSYTDKELNAAVEAIKSGAVGTRKAAQMYGVPRSTLRNKVFKSSEMSRQLPDTQGLPNSTGVVPTPSTAINLNDDDTELVNELKSEGGSTSPNRLNTVSPNRLNTVSPTSQHVKEQMEGMAQYSNVFLKQLEEMRMKQNITEQMTNAAASAAVNNRFFADMFNPLHLSHLSHGYQFLMPQYPAALSAGVTGFEYLNPYASGLMMPYLPELVKNLTQKRLEMEQQMQASQMCTNHNNATAAKHEQKGKRESEDIRIPSYKPSVASGSLSEHPSHLEALKSVMGASSSGSTLPFTNNYLQNLLPFQQSSQNVVSRKLPMDLHSVPSKKVRSEDSSSSMPSAHSSISNGAGSAASGKKRPKRGQYRKYDSELLAQAVRAVQRGEMSVHRAGTFFGVPHSTLEYKVKERHLLRKKKLAENNDSKSNPQLSKTPPAISSNSVCSNSMDSYQSEKGLGNSSEITVADDAVSKDEPSPKKDTSSSNGDSSPNIFNFSGSYGQLSDLNAPASELLKRLHDRAHKKAAEILNNSSSKSQDSSAGNLVESLSN